QNMAIIDKLPEYYFTVELNNKYNIIIDNILINYILTIKFNNNNNIILNNINNIIYNNVENNECYIELNIDNHIYLSNNNIILTKLHNNTIFLYNINDKHKCIILKVNNDNNNNIYISS